MYLSHMYLLSFSHVPMLIYQLLIYRSVTIYLVIYLSQYKRKCLIAIHSLLLIVLFNIGVKLRICEFVYTKNRMKVEVENRSICFLIRLFKRKRTGGKGGNV